MPDLIRPGAVPSSISPDAPQAAPMSIPTEKEGEKTRARMEVQNAVKVLERALSVFGVNSQEGKTLLSSIKSLSKIGGEPGGGDMSKAGVDLLQNIVGGEPKGATAASPKLAQTNPLAPLMGNPMPMPMGGF